MTPLLIKSTARLILRNKVLSFVKIFGLTIGSAIFLLTTLFCLEELSYDKQHPNYKRIHRYVHQVNSPDGLQSFAFTSATTGPALQERYPQVENYTRFFFPRVSVRRPGSDQAFNERKFGFADPNLFSFFNFPIKGSPDLNNVLGNPMEVILTPTAATKYFGSDDPISKTLILNGELIFTVTGLLEDDPARSHIEFDFIASFSSLEVIKNHPVISQQIPASLNLETKGFAAFYTYLLLSPGSPPEKLIAEFPAFIEEFRGKGKSERLKPTLQSLESIHLESALLYEIKRNGSMKIVGVYFFIGLLILAIACINYINTSTAEFLNRARGIGLKKILGISRTSLLWTHIGETAILAALGLVTGCFIAFMILPQFNMLVNRKLTFITSETAMIILAIFFLIIIISGIYPAVNITRSQAMEAFRGTWQVKRGSFALRNVLVLFQLMASFCLLTISLLIYDQLDYLVNKDLGFDAQQVLTINATTVEPEKRLTLKSSLQGNKNIPVVGMCSTPPGEQLFFYGINLPENAADEERRIGAYQSFVDSDFIKALGVNINQGRFFDPLNAADSSQYIIINSSAATAIGDDVLNRGLELPNIFLNKRTIKNVVGIINDYNYASLREKVEPLVLEYNPYQCGYLVVRLQTSSAKQVVSEIEKVWKEIVPTVPFDYTFLDDRFATFYEEDQHQKQVIACIAIIAIGLASLGIFGTTLFLAQRKTKEVGIRKMLGSERSSLLILLFKPTLFLLLISCAAGIPLAYISGNQWLKQYPYRIEFSPLLFFISFAVILLVVILTILYHFLKVTSINPTQILRQVN